MGANAARICFVFLRWAISGQARAQRLRTLSVFASSEAAQAPQGLIHLSFRHGLTQDRRELIRLFKEFDFLLFSQLFPFQFS